MTSIEIIKKKIKTSNSIETQPAHLLLQSRSNELVLTLRKIRPLKQIKKKKKTIFNIR